MVCYQLIIAISFKVVTLVPAGLHQWHWKNPKEYGYMHHMKKQELIIQLQQTKHNKSGCILYGIYSMCFANSTISILLQGTKNKTTSSHHEIKFSETWTKIQLISFKKKHVNVPSGAAMFAQDSMWVKWEWVNIPADRLQSILLSPDGMALQRFVPEAISTHWNW